METNSDDSLVRHQKAGTNCGDCDHSLIAQPYHFIVNLFPSHVHSHMSIDVVKKRFRKG
jgi:hypothetical protein